MSARNSHVHHTNGFIFIHVMAFGLRVTSAFKIWWTSLWVICSGMPFILNVFIYNYDIFRLCSSDTWDFHIDCIHEVFTRLAEARLTAWVFAASTVTYLGWVVDQEKLISAKFQAIKQYLVPTTDAFSSIVGYYRSLCRNCSTVVALNNVLKGKANYVWPLICFLSATVAGVGIWNEGCKPLTKILSVWTVVQ